MPPRTEVLCEQDRTGHLGAVRISRDSYYDDDAHLCSAHHRPGPREVLDKRYVMYFSPAPQGRRLFLSVF